MEENVSQHWLTQMVTLKSYLVISVHITAGIEGKEGGEEDDKINYIK